MKKVKYAVIPVLIGFIVACGGAKMVAPTQADADRGAEQFEGLTVSQLTKGQEVYQNKCTTCHGMKPVNRYTVGQWEKIMPEMISKSDEKYGNTPFSEEEKDLLKRYLFTMAKS